MWPVPRHAPSPVLSEQVLWNSAALSAFSRTVGVECERKAPTASKHQADDDRGEVANRTGTRVYNSNRMKEMLELVCRNGDTGTPYRFAVPL